MEKILSYRNECIVNGGCIKNGGATVLSYLPRHLPESSKLVNNRIIPMEEYRALSFPPHGGS
jgi:hypothetical protein